MLTNMKQKTHAFTFLQQARVLLQWLATIEGLTTFDYNQQNNFKKYNEADITAILSNGISIFEALAIMDSKVFDKNLIKYDEADNYQSYANFKKVVAGLNEFYRRMHGHDETSSQEHVDSFEVFNCLEVLEQDLKSMKKELETSPTKEEVNQNQFNKFDNLLMLLQMMLGVAVNCDVSD